MEAAVGSSHRGGTPCGGTPGSSPRPARRPSHAHRLSDGLWNFLEALLRYRRLVPAPTNVWVSKLDFAECVFPLGTGNTGTRTVEFDVTPRSAPIDGVVGYADTPTNVTAYTSLAMSVRMNPTGVFDVRNGAGYGFVNRVPSTDDLGKVAVKSGNFDGEFTVENHTVR